MEEKTITQIIEAAVSEMCDHYCKYPNEEGHSEDWLFEAGSPCETCPLNRLT